MDANPIGNHTRFINHSCDPNCKTHKVKVDHLTRVAIRTQVPIKAGQLSLFVYCCMVDCFKFLFSFKMSLFITKTLKSLPI